MIVTDEFRAAVRTEISNSYYMARNDGQTMEHAADQATGKVVRLIQGADREAQAAALEVAADLLYGDDRAAGPHADPLSAATWLRERAAQVRADGLTARPR